MASKKEFIEPTIKEVVLESQYIVCCSNCDTDYPGYGDGDEDGE